MPRLTIKLHTDISNSDVSDVHTHAEELVADAGYALIGPGPALGDEIRLTNGGTMVVSVEGGAEG